MTGDIDDMPKELAPFKDQLKGRAMLVKKAKVIPLEAIVRGYLTGTFDTWCMCPLIECKSPGSAWSEYKKSGTVHGISLPPNMIESQQIAEPLFTPSTKAEQGAHDENISPQQGSSSSSYEGSPC